VSGGDYAARGRRRCRCRDGGHERGDHWGAIGDVHEPSCQAEGCVRRSRESGRSASCAAAAGAEIGRAIELPLALVAVVVGSGEPRAASKTMPICPRDVAMAMSPMLRWALARVPLSVRKPRACARRVRGAGVRLQHRRLLVAVDPSPAASLFHGRSGFLPAPGECQQGSSTSTTAPTGHLPKARSRPNTQGPSSLEARKPPTVPISMARAMPSKPSIVLRSRSC
jgi:hypothetical protein